MYVTITVPYRTYDRIGQERHRGEKSHMWMSLDADYFPIRSRHPITETKSRLFKYDDVWIDNYIGKIASYLYKNN